MTDNRIKQIADYNGFYTILNKLTEECGELITEIARYQADDDGKNLYEIYREAVDVINMIEQLRLSEQKFFDDVREYKINRQLERMGKK